MSDLGELRYFNGDAWVAVPNPPPREPIDMTETEVLPPEISRDIAPTPHNLAAIVARERGELEAGIVLARAAPRDEEACVRKMIRSARVPEFASRAEYYYERKGKRGMVGIRGDTVALAREAKRCWGNMASGFRVVEMDLETVHIAGFCVDLEGNLWERQEVRIPLSVKRAGGFEFVGDNPRETRDLILREGARVERNCINKAGVPPWALAKMRDQCKITVRESVKKGLTAENRDETVRALLATFIDLGVGREDIERRLDHDVYELSEEERVELLGIYNAIANEGESPLSHFRAKKDDDVGEGEEADRKTITLDDLKPQDQPHEGKKHGFE